MSQSQASPSLRDIRKAIDALRPTDEDLEAFLIDNFAEVMRRRSASMNRVQKVNLLFELAAPADIAQALYESHPERTADPEEMLAPPLRSLPRTETSTDSRNSPTENEDENESDDAHPQKAESGRSRIRMGALLFSIVSFGFSLLNDRSQPTWKRVLIGAPLTLATLACAGGLLFAIPLAEIECNQRSGRTGVSSVSFSKNGKFVLSSAGYVATVWSTTTRTSICTLKGHSDWVRHSVFSADSEYALTVGKDHTIRLWHVPACTELKRIQTQNSAWSAAFSPDGQRFSFVDGNSPIHIYDLQSRSEQRSLGGSQGLYISIDFAPDGKSLVASRGLDNTLQLFFLGHEELHAQFSGHTDLIWSAHYSSDGKSIVSASHDKTARLWDAATQTSLQVLRGHTAAVVSARFSPDGRKVVSASEDQTARIWDAASGRSLTTLVGHQRGLTDADFSPDGTQVITSSTDGSIILWNTETGEKVREIKPMDLCIRNPAAC